MSSGPFHPTAAFTSVEPLFALQQRLLAQLEVVFRGVDATMSPDAIRAAFLNDRSTRPALDAVQQQIAALKLAIRDTTGAVMPDVDVLITRYDLLQDHATGTAHRQRLEEEATRQGIRVSGYAIRVTPRRRPATG